MLKMFEFWVMHTDKSLTKRVLLYIPFFDNNLFHQSISSRYDIFRWSAQSFKYWSLRFFFRCVLLFRIYFIYINLNLYYRLVYIYSVYLQKHCIFDCQDDPKLNSTITYNCLWWREMRAEQRTSAQKPTSISSFLKITFVWGDCSEFC